jgi:ferredoxin
MSSFIVTDREGVTHTYEGVEGWRLMELLRDYKVGVEGLCGGACDCGTCHVIIDAAQAASLPKARDEEFDMLDSLPFIHKTSRLSCQIIWEDAMDGLTLTLAEA